MSSPASPARHKRRWTPAEEEYLAAQLTRRPRAQIARRLGRTEKAVARYCERRGWYPTRMDRLTSGMLARETGLSPQRLTALARAGRLAARRVPGGRWWLFDQPCARASLSRSTSSRNTSRPPRRGLGASGLATPASRPG